MTASPSSKPITDPLLGRVLDGRFRIIAPIARGGMGAVYKAEQAPLGRLVALKVLSPRGEEASNAEFRRRFLLEASTAAKLTHPNTVRVFDYGQTEDGFFFIAMELLEGKTLKQVIAEGGALEISRAVDVGKQVCRSLREAHRLGVVHRDIKPGNVMLVDRGGEELVKVLDFGLAKDVSGAANQSADDATQTGVFLGSPKYVSPEQVQGEALDARSDIYSLGVVLYEMLSGRPPFAHEQPMQILMAHVRDAPPKLAAPAGREAIPPELEAVVMRAIAKSKDERWADMEALLVALKDWQGSTSVSGDLRLSHSGERLDARSGVHAVSDPMPSDTPSTGLGAASAPPPAPVTPSIPPPTEIGSSAEMSAPGRAPGALVAAVLGLLVVVGGGVYWAMSRSTPTAAPPPRPTPPAVATPEAPAAVPEVVAPPETVPAPVPTPAPVLLSLRSFPSGATVRIGDREYGTTPADVELPPELATEGAELELTFSRAGHRSAVEHLTVHGERMEVSARLTRLPRATGGAGSGSGSSGGSGDVHVDGYRDSPY